MSETITIFTQQRAHVLKEIEETGKYCLTFLDVKMPSQRQEALSWLMSLLNEQYSEEGVYPIWGWTWYYDAPADQNAVHYEVLEGDVMLELEMPKSQVLLTDYDVWCDYLFTLARPEVHSEDLLGMSLEQWRNSGYKETLLNPTPETASYIQAIFPIITRSMIKKVYPIRP